MPRRSSPACTAVASHSSNSRRDGAGKGGTIKAITERVMGFCTAEQARRFLPVVPLFERMMVSSGIILLKRVPYKDVPAAKVKLPKRRIGRYQAVDNPVQVRAGTLFERGTTGGTGPDGVALPIRSGAMVDEGRQ
jgi:hypothetical protein